MKGVETTGSSETAAGFNNSAHFHSANFHSTHFHSAHFNPAPFDPACIQQIIFHAVLQLGGL